MQFILFILLDYDYSILWLWLGILHWSVPERKLDLQYWYTFCQGLNIQGVSHFQLLVPNSNQGFWHWLEFTMPKLRFWFWFFPCIMAWFNFLGMLAVSAVIGIDRTVRTGILRWLEFEINFRKFITVWLVFELLITLIQARLTRRFRYLLIYTGETVLWFGLWYWFGYPYWTEFIFGFMLGPLVVMLI